MGCSKLDTDIEFKNKKQILWLAHKTSVPSGMSSILPSFEKLIRSVEFF